MQIIPVLDIQRGQVVHARGGNRAEYQPIKSVLTRATTPVSVISDLLNWFPFRTIYIADLDAIATGELNLNLYQQITVHFPNIDIWLDAGIRTESDAMLLGEQLKISLVLGSETVSTLDLFQQKQSSRQQILSLDKKAGNLLGEVNFFEHISLWPQRIIAMQLDNIGGDSGPAYDWLADIREAKPDAELYAAGGVRNECDLFELKRKNVAGVLIASALHSGQLDRQVIERVMEQEHCPS